MKIVSWNVNGIRSIFKTSFLNWLKKEAPDIICLQETKADFKELAAEYTQIDGYYAYFNSSKLRKGHSGVAVYTKVKPISVDTEIGIKRIDDEGRCLKLVFADFILFNFYLPNGGRDVDDMISKLDVYKQLFPLFQSLADKNVILVGDFNIAHTELDLYYPKQNYNTLMFTPTERKQLDTLLAQGYIDAFRDIYPERKAYTWWSYDDDHRARDIGWRIDYFFVTKSLRPHVTDVYMQREVLGSDHGPVGLVLDKVVELGEKPVYQKPQSQASLF